MARPLDLRFPLACPHCRAELYPTFEQVQQGMAMRCPHCATPVDLQPSDLPIPPGDVPEMQDFLHF